MTVIISAIIFVTGFLAGLFAGRLTRRPHIVLTPEPTINNKDLVDALAAKEAA